jgi:hypothetical protein
MESGVDRVADFPCGQLSTCNREGGAELEEKLF